jgi:protein SCO1
VRSRVVVGTLAAVLTLAGCAGTSADGSSDAPVSGVSVHDDDGLHGVVLPKPYDVPKASLSDTAGSSYDLATDTTDPLTIVFFGYTHCPDICQVVMADVASAMTRLDAQQRRQVAMLFVTTDPARDDAPTLRSYLDRFDPTFEGLTGSLSTIVRAGNAFGVPIEKGAKMPSGGYEVSHGTQLVGVLPDGTAPYVWTEGTSPADLADDITTILDGDVPRALGQR